MADLLITLVIVGACALFLGIRFYRRYQGKGNGCGCSCSSGCGSGTSSCDRQSK